MVALVLTLGIVRLEAAVLEAVHAAAMGAALSTLQDEVSSQVTSPLGHALC